MTSRNPTANDPWTLARRAARMNPSVIREILKITERPGIISLAGGLPSPDTFPVEAMREATERVLRDCPREALQYAASEGFGPLREWVAAQMAAHRYGWGSDQFGCLDSLWVRESNWRHTATNPTSGAYGIPQSLPAAKMASHGSDWQTNPVTQISWGLEYIRQVYGTPCGAWGHSEAVGWY